MKQKIGHWLPIAVVLQFGVLTGSAQSYIFTGSETTITLNPGTYNITAFGAQGGGSYFAESGGLGAEMEAQFNFVTASTLTLLVGGSGGYGSSGGGGGGGSFVVNGSTPLVIAGGGGGAVYSGGAGTGQNLGNGLTGTGGGFGGWMGGYSGSQGSGGSGGSGGGSGGDGAGGVWSGGGGGYSGDGSGGVWTSGGSSFLNGGAGGLTRSDGSGGFGGGGGGYSSGGGGGGYSGGGGGADGGGGGGGSYIDSSATSILTELAGIRSGNGEIDIMAVPEPTTFSLLAFGSLAGVCFLRRKGIFNFLPDDQI
jgi:hypothetical protein